MNEKHHTSFRHFIRDPWIVGNVIIALVLNAAAWWLIVTQFTTDAEFAPLHYNIYFGIDLFGPSWQIYLLPGSGSAIIALNYLAAALLYSRLLLVSRILTMVATLCQMVCLWASWLIIQELIV
ncbi:MAG: hypothetical protein Q8Q20_00405 [bacterium]|nr:hypothetical protein [bacterium]